MLETLFITTPIPFPRKCWNAVRKGQCNQAVNYLGSHSALLCHFWEPVYFVLCGKSYSISFRCKRRSRLCSSVWLFCMEMPFNYPDWSLQCGLWKAYGWEIENNLIPELRYSHSLPGNQTSPHQSSCNAHFHTQCRFLCRDCPCSSTAFCCRCWEAKYKE